MDELTMPAPLPEADEEEAKFAVIIRNAMLDPTSVTGNEIIDKKGTTLSEWLELMRYDGTRKEEPVKVVEAPKESKFSMPVVAPSKKVEDED